MNIKEAKDVLSRVNEEYVVYCDSGNNEDWFDSGKTVGELLGMIANVEATAKTFAFQKSSYVYEAVYAQVFDSEKLLLFHPKRVVVKNVAKFYLVPLGKTVKIESLLPKVEVAPSSKGMGGISRK